MNFLIKRAAYNDCNDIYRLMCEGAESVAEKEWFCPDTLDFIENHIDKRGFILKALPCPECFVQKELNHSLSTDLRSARLTEIPAAFLLVRFPGTDSDNLGSYLNLSPDQMPFVAHMETLVVNRAFTGNKLMRRLLIAGEKKASSMGCRYLMATVHPDNIYSLRNFEEMGYEKIKEDLKYGGLRRWIVGKRL